MDIKANLELLKGTLPENVKLVAVSKTKPVEDIMAAYNYGHRIFGENKVQELASKYENLPKDIDWHMIGHLQTNKVKYIAPFVGLIHSVDSFKLLNAINTEAVKNNRQIKYLFQLHIAQEKSKFGLTYPELEKIINTDEFKQLSNVKLVGLMGMATFTENKELIRSEFSELKGHFDLLKNNYFKDNDFKELSIGMSSDYEIAVENGSTMVRIGSLVFGLRN